MTDEMSGGRQRHAEMRRPRPYTYGGERRVARGAGMGEVLAGSAGNEPLDSGAGSRNRIVVDEAGAARRAGVRRHGCSLSGKSIKPRRSIRQLADLRKARPRMRTAGWKYD